MEDQNGLPALIVPLRSALIASSRYFLANLSASASRNITTAIHGLTFHDSRSGDSSMRIDQNFP